MSRAEFYAAAAQYAEMKPDGPGQELQPVLQKYEKLNFATEQAGALEPVPARERREVLQLLRV